MPLIVKESENHFEPAPPGLHRAVCVDAVDLGLQESPFGTKHKIKLVWQTEARNRDGERFQVRQVYTASLAEGSNLRRDLEAWRGRPFTSEELKAFDVEKLLGVNCQISVTHAISKKGRTFAKLAAIVGADKKAAKLTPENYTREPWADAQPAEPELVEVDPIDEGHAAQYDTDDTPF
jgi:hypothetical protein